MKKLDLSKIKVDLKELKSDKEINFRERLNFIKFWANYIKTHPDKEWGEQQNDIINAQIR